MKQSWKIPSRLSSGVAPGVGTSWPEGVLELHRHTGALELVCDDAAGFIFWAPGSWGSKLYTRKGIALILMLRIKIQVMGSENRFLNSSRLNGNHLFPGAWDLSGQVTKQTDVLAPLSIKPSLMPI